jgi:hypothetical protein
MASADASATPEVPSDSYWATMYWIIKADVFTYSSGPLFHYTSVDTFRRILECRTLWASHFRYLNDVTEFLYAVEIIAKRLEQRSSEGEILSFAAGSVRSAIPAELTRGPYVISFSENGDSLSQWRGYCSRTAGVSIGFSGLSLHSQLSKLTSAFSDGVYGYLVKCVYDRNEQDKRIDKLINYLLETTRGKDPYDPAARDQTARFVSMVPVVAPMFKDKAFGEEAEWRLIIHSITDTFGGVKFRYGDSMLIPYIEFPLESNPGEFFDGLKKVVIGPTPHEELSKESIRQIITSNTGSSPDIVSTSAIPYRHW